MVPFIFFQRLMNKALVARGLAAPATRGLDDDADYLSDEGVTI